MDKTIKTRNVAKDIKVLDKKAAGLNAVRSAYAKIREVAERDGGTDAHQYRNGADYAQKKVGQDCRQDLKAHSTGYTSQRKGDPGSRIAQQEQAGSGRQGVGKSAATRQSQVTSYSSIGSRMA